MKNLILAITVIILLASCSDVPKQITENERPAYLIASSIMPEGHESITPYANAAHPIMEKFGGEVIVVGMANQSMEHFEGDWKKDASMTIFKFPSKDALMSFWNSKEYQDIKHLRTDAITPNFTFAVDGFLASDFDNYEEN